VRPEGLGKLKKSNDLIRIQPATFQLAAELLSHYAIKCPIKNGKWSRVKTVQIS
jgi:hypothetical protein